MGTNRKNRSVAADQLGVDISARDPAYSKIVEGLEKEVKALKDELQEMEMWKEALKLEDKLLERSFIAQIRSQPDEVDQSWFELQYFGKDSDGGGAGGVKLP
ncbi:unnamed protein product [Calypogeia fissa]